MKQWLIFTDLDGSLLDHDNYSHRPADALLKQLNNDHIPVIFTTSKTRAEVIHLRKELKNHHPFIVENGAAVFIPYGYFPAMPEGCFERDGYWVYELTKPRQHWLDLLNRAATIFTHNFSHFAAMKEKAIAEITGLTLTKAKLANKREYSEPIFWLGANTRKKEFIYWLQRQGGTLLQGGRFLHLSGDCNKGIALTWMMEQFRIFSVPCDLSLLAIGDSENDIDMLEASDVSLIIRSPAHPPPKLKRTTAYVISDEFGPKGWANGVRKIIYDQ
jgi:mannosyl-3-phosphoglycerate phosphatase family protein